MTPTRDQAGHGDRSRDVGSGRPCLTTVHRTAKRDDVRSLEDLRDALNDLDDSFYVTTERARTLATLAACYDDLEESYHDLSEPSDGDSDSATATADTSNTGGQPDE